MESLMKRRIGILMLWIFDDFRYIRKHGRTFRLLDVPDAIAVDRCS